MHKRYEKATTLLMIIFRRRTSWILIFRHSERVLDGRELHSRGWELKSAFILFLIVLNGVRAGCVIDLGRRRLD